MSTSHSTPALGWGEKPPTARQRRALHNLASSRGQSFTYPMTRTQASAEIKRLMGLRPSSRLERTRERDTAKALPVDLTNAASVRDDEITGYGSTARWARHVPEQLADEVCAPWDLAARRRRDSAANRKSNYRRRTA